jgi:hypothetical protein
MTITYADQKDLDRARDLKLQIVSNGLDKALGSARKMAKLIKDTDKLLRRTEAVLSEDLRLAGPFIDRCREFREYRLSEMVKAYDTGKTVGKYATSMPKKYTPHYPQDQEAFMAGFVETYGFNNFIAASKYGL